MEAAAGVADADATADAGAEADGTDAAADAAGAGDVAGPGPDMVCPGLGLVRVGWLARRGEMGGGRGEVEGWCVLETV